MRATAIPARILLAIGAIAASVAFWAFSAQRTILDPAATRELATQLIDTERVADSLISKLTDQLHAQIPPGVAESGVADSEIAAVAEIAIRDPRVAEAFGATIASLHEQLLAGDQVDQVEIDTSVINAALRDAVAEIDPTLVDELDGLEPVSLAIDASSLPSLRPVDDGADALLLTAAVLAVIGFGLGVAAHPEPWTAVAIVGRRLAAVAIFPVVLYLIIPAGLRALSTGWAETATPFASAYGGRILPAALTLLVTGVALWVGGQVGRRSAPAPRAARPASAARPARRTVPGQPRPTVVAPGGRTDLRL